MVFVLSVAAAALLGLGWVVQQRVAATPPAAARGPWGLVLRLARTPGWWAGIAVMAAGQSLAAWALQLGAVTVVDPVLITCLLFAFAIAAIHSKHRVSWREVIGTLVVSSALALFLVVADPQPDTRLLPTTGAVLLAVGLVTIGAAAVALAGKVDWLRRGAAEEAAALAAAAGVLYGLQDAATRGTLDALSNRDLAYAIGTPWPYVVLAAAVPAVILSQTAFRAAHLDRSLPPMAAAQPIAGAALGVGLLNDRVALGAVNVALELCSLVLTLAGVLLIGRSPALRGREVGQSS
jgi:hypothetical protein